VETLNDRSTLLLYQIITPQYTSPYITRVHSKVFPGPPFVIKDWKGWWQKYKDASLSEIHDKARKLMDEFWLRGYQKGSVEWVVDNTDPASFVGEWQARLAPGTEAIRVGEIRYPVWLKISEVKGGLKVEFRDQFDKTCEVKGPMVLNDGLDLVFPSCGVTKHPGSFAPIHHAKVIDGKLRGVVTTKEKLFEWVGEKKP
jgi:hypothetical protein